MLSILVLVPTLVLLPRAQQTQVLGQKINGEITVSAPAVEGQVDSLVLVPDGQRAVFVRGEEFLTNYFEVCVAPLDASSLPLVLSNAPFLFGEIAVEVEPAGVGAVFKGSTASGGPVQLFRALLDDSVPAVQITGADTQVFHVTPDGQRILFVADHDVSGEFELFSAPVDGGAAPIQLSGALVAGGDVLTFLATSTRAVYTADQDTNGVNELYSVPVDGSAAAIRLNAPLIAAGDVSASEGFPPFRIAPDGTRVVYRADQVVDQRFELYSVPIGGGPAVLVSLSSGSNTRHYEIDPNGTRVVFADRMTPSQWEVLSAPLDGSAAPVTLSGPLVAQGVVEQLAVTPDGARVLYRADQDQNDVIELFSAPLDGSAARVQINPPLTSGGDVHSFLLSSARVVYRADQDVDGSIELFSAPVDGSAAPVQLHPALQGAASVPGDGQVVLTPDGQRVVFVADILPGTDPELVSAPADGSGPLVMLDPNGELSAAIVVTPDSARVAYVSKDPFAYSFDAFSVPAAGGASPVRFNESTFIISGDVGAYSLSERGDFAVYIANQDTTQRALYATRLAESFPSMRLNDDTSSSVNSFHPVPGGERVLFHQDTLYVVPLDGSAAPQRLTDPLVESTGFDPEFTPDGAHAVYASTLLTGSRALRRVPTDGSSAPITIAEPYTFIVDTALTSDGTTAVFVATTGEPGYRIFSAPLAPGATETLTDLLDDRPRFRLTPDGARVVYLDDSAVPGSYEVYSAPVDGSAPPVRLNRPLLGGESVGVYYIWLYYHDQPFEISPDSQHVVFVANSQSNGSFQLFRAPADGSSVAQQLAEWPFVLDPTNEDGESVGSFHIDPRGARVVYQTGDRGKLFSLPLLGAGPAVELTRNSTSGRGVPALFDGSAIRFGAGGTQVVFLSDQAPPSSPRLHLYAAPIDGRAAPRKINGAMQASGNVEAFEVDGLDAVFIADKRFDGRFELFRAPLFGGTITDLSLPAVAGGRVWGFQARRGQVLYWGDQDGVSVYELYFSTYRKGTLR